MTKFLQNSSPIFYPKIKERQKLGILAEANF
jgi:hypothetical protein